MSRCEDLVDDHPRLAAALHRLRSSLPPLNFITIHYAYFVLVCLIFSVVFWCSSSPALSISYVDSLFLVVSAMTEAGLNTVNLSQMTTWQQVILWLLILLGSSIWVSIWTVLARKHVFEQRFEAIVQAQRAKSRLHRTGSTLSLGSLPLVQRLLPFGKAQTISTAGPLQGSGPRAVDPTPGNAAGAELPEDRPAVVRRHTTSGPPRPKTPLAQSDRAPPVTADEYPPAEPLSPEPHIAFEDKPHPNQNADANANANGTATGSSYFPNNRPTRRKGAAKGPTENEKPHHFDMRDFLAHRTPGRNAQFHDLTLEEREQLGGYEYRSLRVLAVVVPLYFFAWQFLGCVALGAWINNYQPEAAAVNAINPYWAGIFNGVSAFNNSGMSLLDANMIPFETSTFVLITMGLMILAGNTAYPIFLRLIFWTGLKVLRLTTAEETLCEFKATLDFILKYPRRVYTNLFPSRPTWWLLFMLIALNSTDWVCFELLNLGNPVIEAIPRGSRVLDGLFQALAVRSGGFYVVPIASLYIGLQILYVIMMYISAYPVVITMRHSNVYEERSLGIYANDTPDDSSADPERHGSPTAHTATGAAAASKAVELGRALQRKFAPWHGVGAAAGAAGWTGQGLGGGGGSESHISFISQQIQGQLAHDMWLLVLAVLVISTIETGQFLADPVDYSVFNVMFEVVSAYGCVGISVGLPWAAYSFSGGWHAASKLVLCVVMLRGRHRGLPVALDRAVRLPGEQLHREEEEDHRIRRSMTAGG